MLLVPSVALGLWGCGAIQLSRGSSSCVYGNATHTARQHAGYTGLAVLQATLSQASPAAGLVGARIRWPKLLGSLPRVPAILADFAPPDERHAPAGQGSTAVSKGSATVAGTTAALHTPASAATAAEKPAVALAPLLEQVTHVARGLLGTAPQPDQPLMEAGLDSLGECLASSRARIQPCEPTLFASAAGAFRPN